MASAESAPPILRELSYAVERAMAGAEMRDLSVFDFDAWIHQKITENAKA